MVIDFIHVSLRIILKPSDVNYFVCTESGISACLLLFKWVHSPLTLDRCSTGGHTSRIVELHCQCINHLVKWVSTLWPLGGVVAILIILDCDFTSSVVKTQREIIEEEQCFQSLSDWATLKQILMLALDVMRFYVNPLWPSDVHIYVYIIYIYIYTFMR